MMPPKMILSPIDFSNHSDDALKVAADLAARLGARNSALFTLFRCCRGCRPPSTHFQRSGVRARASQGCRAAIEVKLRRSSRRTRFDRENPIVGTTANDTGMEILRIAEHNNADLIVIATHGMTGWHKLAFGSVTEKVVRLAACPVLVLRVQPDASSSESSKKTGLRNGIALALKQRAFVDLQEVKFRSAREQGPPGSRCSNFSGLGRASNRKNQTSHKSVRLPEWVCCRNLNQGALRRKQLRQIGNGRRSSKMRGVMLAYSNMHNP